MGLYCASKFALEALAKVYRYELASQGIDSVVIEPGAYATAAIAKLERGEDPERRSGYGEMALVPERIQAKMEACRPTRRNSRMLCCRSSRRPLDSGNSGIAWDQAGRECRK
jgi:NAD(P)-dependent dehydrogenase (short-subunit alcohol dehydrogenase family)